MHYGTLCGGITMEAEKCRHVCTASREEYTMQTIDKKTTRREQGDSNNISTTTTTHHNEGTTLSFFWIKRSVEKHCRISHVESLFVLQNKTDSKGITLNIDNCNAL